MVCIRSQNSQIQRDRKLKSSCQGSCGRDSGQFVFNGYNSSNKHETMSPHLMLLILKNVEVANAVCISHVLKKNERMIQLLYTCQLAAENLGCRKKGTHYHSIQQISRGQKPFAD